MKDDHRRGWRQLEAGAPALALQGHFLALVFEVPHVILGHEAVAHIRPVSAERVDPVEVNSILADACAARNGWKVILARCAPEKSKTISTLPQI